MKGKETEGMDAIVAKMRKAMKIVMKVKKVAMVEVAVMLDRKRGDRRTKGDGERAKVRRASETTKLG